MRYAFLALPPLYVCSRHCSTLKQSGSVILLEFNSGPDLKMTGSRLDYIISDMLKGMVDTVLTGGHFPSLQGQEPASSPTGSPVSEPVVDIVARDEDPGSVSGWDMVYSQVWPVGSSSFSFA